MKPKNVMMDEKEKVKLIDFYIARVFYGEKERDTMLKGTKGTFRRNRLGTGRRIAARIFILWG